MADYGEGGTMKNQKTEDAKEYKELAKIKWKMQTKMHWGIKHTRPY